MKYFPRLAYNEHLYMSVGAKNAQTNYEEANRNFKIKYLRGGKMDLLFSNTIKQQTL